ncbi:hypothetical protein POTOM_051349 [Populus tomentosa]|uniref:Pentatricopeptide repeat-containing protein n=1 Tax=Populus tomentosa TaxID=118781 RepID=A0A8X8C155_POPTO|nr:hypothetical protein POTOM_051349 [Populus tomentosa]
MAMPWGMALWMANMVWVALIGWVSSCLTVADELASSLRTGDIGFLTARAQRWVYEVVPMPQVLGEDLCSGAVTCVPFWSPWFVYSPTQHGWNLSSNTLELQLSFKPTFADHIHSKETILQNLELSILCNCALNVCKVGQIAGSAGLKISVPNRDCIRNSDIARSNWLITRLTREGNINDARQVFDKMHERDVVTWTAVISGYIKCGLIVEARRLFDRVDAIKDVVTWTAMLSGYDGGAKPNEGTFVNVLGACSDLAGLGEGQQVHLLISKSVYLDRTYVASALLNMYSKCGELSIARKIFDDVVIGQRDLVLWNGMIAAYAHHGCGMEAIELFEDMQGLGFKPNDVSYVELLSACSHAGLVDKGLNYFDELRRDNSIQLREDHHACLVDLCGRAGRLKEAYDFIKQLGTKASSSIWGGLLAGCNAHGDLEIGQLAAKELEKEDPENAGTYLLLSNIYASGRKWREASRVRLKMKEKGLKKQPGCSWIEVGNRVHVFLARDKSHYQSNLIYSLVHDIHAEMKKVEHVPNNDFVDEEDFSSTQITKTS